MENNKENLLAVISSRRRQNAKSQLKQILLESYEIYGPELVQEVEKECSDIYNEYVDLLADGFSGSVLAESAESDKLVSSKDVNIDA